MFYAEYVLKGDTGQAVKTYRNSLELIPGNSNAVEMLEKLEQVESQRPSECRAGTQSLAFTIARISSI